ncbi:MAG: Mrp/NBP35 family ATP-binding protein, partial [Clostridiales bacterium]|nr:Mrp/NBP35 family ATP-binding protein [Clostridiales bacterium]
MEKQSLLEKPNKGTTVKKVIAIVSGKGGVGKSLVTGLSAVTARKLGYVTGILDADVTGPSIPQMFGIHEKAYGSEMGLFPLQSKGGVRVMSLNLLLEEE